MKRIGIRIWHKIYKRMMDVKSVIGLDTGTPTYQTGDTTVQDNDAVKMYFIGQYGSQGFPIYEMDYLSVPKPGDHKEHITALLWNDNGLIKLVYDYEDTKSKKSVRIELPTPDWSLTTIVGNYYTPTKKQ